MKIRSYLVAKWPELLAIASLALIALFVWDRFFPLKWMRRNSLVHLSCFAYRDVNRNGVYDLGDRPYAGLPVTMERPKGRPVKRESNLAGFANFDMSEGNRKAEIYRPGDYTVRVEAPPDWDLTSSNSPQTITIQKRDGTAVGLIAVRTIEPVGVAPRLRISGSIEASLNSANTILKAKPEAGAESIVPITKAGSYSFPATRGAWRLEFVSPNGNSMIRNLSVESYPVIVSRMSSNRLSFPPKSKLKIIGFDNLTTSDTLCEIPNRYEGFDWRNWVATHQKFYEANGFMNATTSFEYSAYTSSGHPATLSSPTMFDFVGVFVTSVWPEGGHHDIIVKAWRNDTEAYHDRFRATTAGPIYFDADYRSVTRIEFSSAGYWQIALDDLACRID